MKELRKITVVLTGGGGPAIPGMIEMLRKSIPCRIIATDMEKMVPGFFVADKGAVLPAGSDPRYLNALRELCRREKVDAVVSVVDEELIHCLELEKEGIAVVQPEREFVKLCLDKFALMKALAAHDLYAPRTELLSETDFKRWDFPVMAKPRVGRGSRGIKILTSESHAVEFRNSLQNLASTYIIQDFIQGPEYTVSVVTWRDGLVQAVVPKEIISKIGVTRMAVTRKNQEIDTYCRQIQEQFKANGPFNVQLRLCKKTNRPFAFEINPRFSTSITLTAAAGVNELAALVQQAVFGKHNFNFSNWKEGVTLLRRYQDHFADEQDLALKPVDVL